MAKVILYLLCFASVLLKGTAFPNGNAKKDVTLNSTASTIVSSGSDGDASCGTSGQVTNVIIQGNKDGEVGPQGEQGEIGPAGPPGPSGSSSGGVSYTRWGRTTCPTTQGTQLVYGGLMVGSMWNEAGSSNYLCLHDQPQFLQTTPGVQEGRTYLYGTEYEARASPPAFSNMRNHDAPCSVCYTSGRTTTITIPGRTSCPSSWTREYYGYLMAERSDHPKSGRAPVCVDVGAESVPGSAPRNERSQLYFMEIICHGIRCPPYSSGAELTCVVCSK